MGFFILLTVLLLIVAVLIVLVVLVQNSKGGGLASNFAGSNQYMGVRKTADFLEKFTWSLAVAMMVLVLGSSKVIPKSEGPVMDDTEIRGSIDDIPIPTTTTPFTPNVGDESTSGNDDNNEGGTE
jgi:preprotein translocase subunit SecG